jgi:class 3 adenylate cyclase
MRCSSCGAENPRGLKFCNGCGAPFGQRCGKCGFENAPTAKFCGECAAPLGGVPTAVAADRRSAAAEASATFHVAPEQPAGDATDGERKTVTALFADIKGSMELMEDLDPEEARAIVDPALKLMIDAVHRYGGYVAQSTGDGIFALFGAPIAHEDHPQRALYAALRMHDDIGRYAERLRAEKGVNLQVRVGVNTGEVVVRSIHTDESHTEYTPIGHSTGLASRLQALASPGSIAISGTVRKLVEGYFTLKALGPARIKGVGEPVEVFEVTGLGPLRTRLQRSARGGLTKFVGREREMAALRHAAELAQRGHGQMVAAVAEAGVGKSRLIYEFKAFSVSHGKASAFLPVIDLLHSYFGIEPGDDTRKRREKVTGKVITLDRSLEDALPYLFGLLGLIEGDDPLGQMDAQVRQRRILDWIKRILLRESLNQPLLVIFEDLHWIDDETQALLNLLAESIATAKILMLVNYRPEYTHGWGNKTYYTQLRLDPLGLESAEEMLDALLGAGPELAALRRLTIERTEGNPFFMEEIVQALYEEGVLARNGGAHLTRPLDGLKIPTTVQAILASRIDRLASAEKDLLQTLAVIGKEFPLALVRALRDGADQELERMLEDLQLAEFIYEQPAAGGIEYTFKHALTQEVAYNSMLMERRKALHERIGAAIETLHAGQLQDYLAELAYHYSRSSNSIKAIDYLWSVANQASQRSLYSEAIGYANRGLELTAAMPDGEGRVRDELRLQIILGIALMAARGFSSEEVEHTFSRACELARRLNDSGHLFAALQGVWGFRYTRGDFSAARKVAEESMAVAQSLNDRGAIRQAHYALGASVQQTGELNNARDHLERVLALKDVPEPVAGFLRFGPDLDVMCLTALSDVLFTLGYPDQSLRKSYEAKEVVKRESDPFSFAMASMAVIQAHCARREARKGEELCRDLVELSNRHGFPFWLAVANRCLSWAAVLQGRLEEGIALINRQLDQIGGADDMLTQYNLLPTLAEAYGRLGKFDLAFAALEQWDGVRREYSVASMDKIYHRMRGEVLFRAGSLDAAEKSLRAAVQLSLAEGAKMEQLRSTIALARLLRETDRGAEARAILAEVYRWFTEGFDTADLKDAKALLDELGAQR